MNYVMYLNKHMQIKYYKTINIKIKYILILTICIELKILKL